MNGRATIPLVLVALNASSCASERTHSLPGRVVFPSPMEAPAIRVRSGRHWPILDSPVSPDGRFSVPDDAQVVTAYVDADRDSRLSQYLEPSVGCKRTSGKWVCEIRNSRLTLQRMSALNRRGDRIAKVLSLFGEDYRRDGKPDLEASFCVGGEMGGCTAVRPTVLGTDGQVARAFLPCQRDLPDDAIGELIVEHRRRDGSRRLTVPVPSVPVAELEFARDSRSTVLVAHVGFRPTHVYGWIGTDGSAPAWDTERSANSLDVSAGVVRITLPNAVLDGCRRCKAMLQVAAVHEAGELRTVSEVRFLASEAR